MSRTTGLRVKEEEETGDVEEIRWGSLFQRLSLKSKDLSAFELPLLTRWEMNRD